MVSRGGCARGAARQPCRLRWPTGRPALVVLADPFVDKDGDGRVAGRPLRGLVETLAPFLGISGDRDEGAPSPAAADLDGFFRRCQQLTGTDPRTASRQQRIEAIQGLFGLRALMPRQRPRAAGPALRNGRHGIGRRSDGTLGPISPSRRI
jgi:hypothetical protein